MKAMSAHMNNFNLIRLLAALQVMVVHSIDHFGLSGPWLQAFKAIPGVPTFFLISGYLIGASYQRTGPARMGQFFKNRFLRIYPGLWACVLVATAAMAATGYLGGKDVSASHFGVWIAGQASVVQFYNPGFMRQFGTGVLNGALWTIAVELQFYVLVPVMFYLIKNRGSLFWMLFVVSLGFNLLLRLDPDNHTMGRKLLSVSFLPWVYMFMLGFLAAYYPLVVARIKAVPYVVWMASYMASMCLIGTFKENGSNAIHPLAVIILGAMILKFGTARIALPKSWERVLQQHDFSYGLYLYHMPAINILLYASLFSAGVNFAFAVSASLTAAVISWFIVEQPALRRKVATAVPS